MAGWGTKVQTTTLSALEGDIINSLDPVVGVDPTKNAPSISVVNTALGTLDTAVDTINDNLSGFKFYPTGTQLVAYIEGHGWYNTDGKYVVWGTATAQALVQANPNTFYGRQSEEDCRGEVGADTATPFSKLEEPTLLTNTYKSLSANQQYTNFTLDIPMTGFRYIIINHTQYKFGNTSKLTILDGFYNPQSFIELETFKTTELLYKYDDNGVTCSEYYQYIDDSTIKAKSGGLGFSFTIWGIK